MKSKIADQLDTLLFGIEYDLGVVRACITGGKPRSAIVEALGSLAVNVKDARAFARKLPAKGAAS